MPASLRPATWLLLLALFSALWFTGLDARRLMHPDEGRYAEIAREMQASGDWVTPRLDGLKYFEKPPLQYWLTAAAYDLFGVREWTTRLPPALFGWLAVLAIGYAGLRLAGPPLAGFAAMAQASAVWPIGNAHLVTLDTVLSGCLAIALAAFVVAQAATTTTRAERRWMVIAWVAVAGAVMTKGLIGLVIPGGALVVYTLLSRDLAVWRRLHLLPGVIVLVLLCAPWFVLVASRNPEFARFFFIHEHVERFLTTEHRRTGAWWYFVPILLVGLLPWTGVLAMALRRAGGAVTRAANGFAWTRFCWAWIAFVFAFFSLSGSKLPSYILPLFPAAALLIGLALARMSPRLWQVLLGTLAIAAALLAAAVWLGYDALIPRLATLRTPPQVYAAFGAGLKQGLAAVALGMLLAWLIGRQATPLARTLAVVVITLGMNLGLRLAFWANDGLSPSRSAAGLVAELRAATPPYDPRAPFYQIGLYDQTLPWYLGRTTTVVAYRDELALGLDAEPDRGIASVPAWIDVWRRLPQGYALMDPATFVALTRDGVPMREAAHNPRYVVAARR
jgi:4-amino-4-deoxy-L-arabinose transferase-like glycosyltransferase